MQIQTINLPHNKQFKYLKASYHNGKLFLCFHGFSQIDDKYLVKDNEKAFYSDRNKYWVIKEIA